MVSYTESQWISVKYSEYISIALFFVYTTHYIWIYSNKTSATYRAGSAYPSGALEFIHGFKWVSFFLIFSFLCNVLWIIVCPFVLFLLAILMSVLQFTASNCPFWYLQTFLKQIRSCHGRVV